MIAQLRLPEPQLSRGRIFSSLNSIVSTRPVHNSETTCGKCTVGSPANQNILEFWRCVVYSRCKSRAIPKVLGSGFWGIVERGVEPADAAVGIEERQLPTLRCSGSDRATLPLPAIDSWLLGHALAAR